MESIQGNLSAGGLCEVTAPSLKWAQNRTTVFLTIEIPDFEMANVSLTESRLNLIKQTEILLYKMELQFFDGVDPTKLKYQKLNNGLFLTLPKIHQSSAFWPRLYRQEQKMHNVATDWNRFVDEEDDINRDKIVGIKNTQKIASEIPQQTLKIDSTIRKTIVKASTKHARKTHNQKSIVHRPCTRSQTRKLRRKF